MRGHKGLVAGVIAAVCVAVAGVAWIVLTRLQFEPQPTEYRAEWNNGKTVEIVTVNEPVPSARVASPLVVRGKVAGSWYFEGDFPVEVLDARRRVVGQGYGAAQGEWMTEKPVSFTATVKFKAPASDRGFVVLHRANPSDEREHDASVEIPVRFR